MAEPLAPIICRMLIHLSIIVEGGGREKREGVREEREEERRRRTRKREWNVNFKRKIFNSRLRIKVMPPRVFPV